MNDKSEFVKYDENVKQLLLDSTVPWTRKPQEATIGFYVRLAVKEIERLESELREKRSDYNLLEARGRQIADDLTKASNAYSELEIKHMELQSELKLMAEFAQALYIVEAYIYWDGDTPESDITLIRAAIKKARSILEKTNGQT